MMKLGISTSLFGEQCRYDGSSAKTLKERYPYLPMEEEGRLEDGWLHVFIFDTHILDTLSRDDKRVTFIYQSVLQLKQALQNMGLDLAIAYGELKKIFTQLKKEGFDKVLCSVDHDHYAKTRDHAIEQIIPLRRFNDAFLIDPKEHLNQSHLPYKVFTPLFHKENGVQSNIFVNYPHQLVEIQSSRLRAIEVFKKAADEKV